MLSNREIARLLGLYAELLQLHEQNERLGDILSGTAYRLGRMEESVSELDEGELGKQFRPEVVKIIKGLKQTNTIEDLENLIQLTPPGLFDMMRIKGLGGKKLAVIWRTAKLDNVEDLLHACKANKLSGIPGFGAKTEQNIIVAIEALNTNSKRFHYADVADIAAKLENYLKTHFKSDYISLCGDIRRQATTVNAIEILAAIPVTKFKEAAIKKVLTIQKSDKDVTHGFTLDEMPVNIFHCTKADFYLELFKRTGNDAHVQRVLQTNIIGKLSTEADIYKKAKLPYILPEMREDIAEWEYIKDPKPLVADTDIKGVVHNHTTYSDGVDKLEDFVSACKKKKYEYVVISDHSQNAHYAGGLKPDKVLRQFEEIDKLNKKLGIFKIFKSIECDILVSGELDYDKSLLKQFDLVIVSVHQLLKMNEEKATARLIKAIENPSTTILGHMTGRQLLIRPGYPVDFKKVIDSCAANGVVIEINANPYRLDMDWSRIPYALQKGVMISINPDAHSIHEIDNIRWGVSAARKGGLTKDMTWNAMSLKEVQTWLKKKGK